MMALAKKRGYVLLDHPEWGKVRLTMSTHGHQPIWPKNRVRPRVLVETDRTLWRGEDELRGAGFDVALCQGPCGPKGRCPVLDGEPCPLIAGADAVVIDFPANDPLAIELMTAERILHPGVRMISGYAPVEDGVSRRCTSAELLAAIVDLADERDVE